MLLAFGSQARTGKDTACKYLSEKYGGTIYHFSDPLYQILYYAQDICGFKKEKDVKFLQWVGTEWGRNIDSNVWVESTIKNLNKKENCYIADVRFKNEAQRLRDLGFTLIRIIRDDRPIDRDNTHSSESGIPDFDWDYIIDNNGSITDFYENLENIIKILN